MNIKKERNYKKVFTLTVVIIILAGYLSSCGYMEGVVQKAEKSYLWFTGNTENAIVYIDNKEFARLSPSYYVDESGTKRQKTEPIHYQIEPGKHEIRIEKDGKVLVNRSLLLGNQMTKEIEVP